MSDGSESRYLNVEHFSRAEKTTSCSAKRCIFGFTFSVSLILNVLLSVVLVRRRGRSDSVSPVPYSAGLVSAVHEDSVCTVCSAIGVQPESFSSGQIRDLSVHQMSEGYYLCCIHNAHGLRRLLALFEDKYHLKSSPAPAITINKKTSGAHLYVDSQSLTTSPPNILWTKEYGFGSAYNSSDVLIDNNQLHITRPGLYHIYSFITYKTEHHRHRPDNVVHTISRRNKHFPELGSHVILIDKTTLPEVSEKFMTSFLSATVRLRRDDQLYVRVSKPSYIYRFAPSNFFGLNFVGE